MTRRQSASETMRQAKAKRSLALVRSELRQVSVPRISAAGPTSAPLKAVDPDIARMIEEALTRRATDAKKESVPGQRVAPVSRPSRDYRPTSSRP